MTEFGYYQAKDPRSGRNHILTKNPLVAKCGKRVPEGFAPKDPDAPTCGRCNPDWHPTQRNRVTIPKGGFAKDGSYYRAGAQ
jgi:hypothetical protein